MIKVFGASGALKACLFLMLFVLLFSVCWKFVVCGFIPQYDFVEYPVIPLFFMVFYMLVFAILFNKSLNSGNFMKRYLLFKIAKLLAIVAWVFVLCKEFAMSAFVFLVFYLFMIAPETVCFMYMKKRVYKTI